MADSYSALLGDAWGILSPGVRRSHTVPLHASGNLDFFRAAKGFAGLLARAMKLPPPGEAVPTRLTLEAIGDAVRWIREFGDMRAVSLQRLVGGKIIEEAGPFQIVIEASVEGESIVHRQTGLYLLGIRLPMLFGPSVRGRVSPGFDDGSWTIEVEIGHVLAGTVCRYSGVMRAQ